MAHQELKVLRNQRLKQRYNEIYKEFTHGSHEAKHDMTVDKLKDEFFISSARINRILYQKNK